MVRVDSNKLISENSKESLLLTSLNDSVIKNDTSFDATAIDG